MSKKDTGKMRKYELMLILKATLPDAQKKTAIKKINSQLTDLGGSIESEDVWGKRILAYPVKKHQEGYYLVNNVQLVPDKANDYRNLLKINSDILRFIINQVEHFDGPAAAGDHDVQKRF